MNCRQSKKCTNNGPEYKIARVFNATSKEALVMTFSKERSFYDYCIVGAGPSGLTAAYKLLKGGKTVLLIERNDKIGGLARSYNYDGQIFDIGPKRFHTDDQIVLDFIDEVTKGDIFTIGRSTKVHFLNKYFEWPLQTKDLIKMPPHVSLKCFFDLLRKPEIKDGQSFREYIVSKYGETLYQLFFAPYTSKFLRWDALDIHSDWASTGINRTVIDKRVDANTLMALVKSLVLPSKVKTEFLYPSKGGFGGFYERLVELCHQYDGFHLMVNDEIVSLDRQEKKLGAGTKNGQSLSFGDLIWTGNLNNLTKIITSDQRVNYLNTIFYNIICKQEGVTNKTAQWIYVSNGDSLISRITCMREFAPYTCKEGYYNFVCELTDSQIKPVYFRDPKSHTEGILNELVSMRFLKNKKYIESVHVNPVLDTYPIYHKQYKRDFGKAYAAVKKFSQNVHLLGRSGAFWYNNSDHSIRFALAMADKLLGKCEEDFDYRSYFGGTYKAVTPQLQEA